MEGKRLCDYVLSKGDKPDDIQRLDTSNLAKLLWDDGNKNSYTLSKCYERAGLGSFSAHRAMADVEATLKLLEFFKDTIRGNKLKVPDAEESTAIVQPEKGMKELPADTKKRKFQF